MLASVICGAQAGGIGLPKCSAGGSGQPASQVVSQEDRNSCLGTCSPICCTSRLPYPPSGAGAAGSGAQRALASRGPGCRRAAKGGGACGGGGRPAGGEMERALLALHMQLLHRLAQVQREHEHGSIRVPVAALCTLSPPARLQHSASTVPGLPRSTAAGCGGAAARRGRQGRQPDGAAGRLTAHGAAPLLTACTGDQLGA